jgi:hypothetical protein
MPISKNTVSEHSVIFFIFIIFSSFLNASQDTENLSVEKDPLEVCEIELREFCNLETFDVKKERECVKRNIPNLSSECSKRIGQALEATRPFEVPKFTLPTK